MIQKREEKQQCNNGGSIFCSAHGGLGAPCSWSAEPFTVGCNSLPMTTVPMHRAAMCSEHGRVRLERCVPSARPSLSAVKCGAWRKAGCPSSLNLKLITYIHVYAYMSCMCTGISTRRSLLSLGFWFEGGGLYMYMHG